MRADVVKAAWRLDMKGSIRVRSNVARPANISDAEHFGIAVEEATTAMANGSGETKRVNPALLARTLRQRRRPPFPPPKL